MIKVKGTFITELPNGQHVLVLLANNEQEQELLYHHLAVDAYQFKNQIANEIGVIDFISAGYRNENDQVIWNKDYIPVPKWYDMN